MLRQPTGKVAVSAENANMHEMPFDVLADIVAWLHKDRESKIAANNIGVPGPINEFRVQVNCS